MKRMAPLMALMLLLAACGGATAHPGTSPTATPGAQPPAPLFAVLEGASGTTGANTVAIMSVDGTTVATRPFQPRQAPYLGMVAAMLQSEAQVGATGVYYADGAGVVRLLGPSGWSSVVATFPMTPEQHELWYAVSPEGDRLLGGVLTVPPVRQPGPGQPLPVLVGDWKLDLESATAGRTTVLRHVESPEDPDYPNANWKLTLPVGWTQAGPVAMVGGPISTQNVWYGGPLFTIGPSGDPATRVGGSDCRAASILASGTAACVDGSGKVTVRSSSGQVLWTPGVDGFNALRLKLSPAGDAITDGRHAATATGAVTLPDNFLAQGWLDPLTLYGRLTTDHGPGNLAFVRLGDVTTVHDLGFAADFVGPVPAGR